MWLPAQTSVTKSSCYLADELTCDCFEINLIEWCEFALQQGILKYHWYQALFLKKYAIPSLSIWYFLDNIIAASFTCSDLYDRWTAWKWFMKDWMKDCCTMYETSQNIMNS